MPRRRRTKRRYARSMLRASSSRVVTIAWICSSVRGPRDSSGDGAGTRGMCQAIAIALARAGVTVAAHNLDDCDAIAETVKGVEAFGRRFVTLKAGLRTAPAGRCIVDDAVTALGGSDIVMSSVGAATRKPFLDLPDDD